MDRALVARSYFGVSVQVRRIPKAAETPVTCARELPTNVHLLSAHLDVAQIPLRVGTKSYDQL